MICYVTSGAKTGSVHDPVRPVVQLLERRGEWRWQNETGERTDAFVLRCIPTHKDTNKNLIDKCAITFLVIKKQNNMLDELNCNFCVRFLNLQNWLSRWPKATQSTRILTMFVYCVYEVTQ